MGNLRFSVRGCLMGRGCPGRGKAGPALMRRVLLTGQVLGPLLLDPRPGAMARVSLGKPSVPARKVTGDALEFVSGSTCGNHR